jgi:DNA-binding transcriptional regulator YdaS (Cro superfamily)
MASNKPRVPKVLPTDVREALAAAVLRLGSQTAVARDLGVSPAVVNHLLKDRYPGDVATMADRIRGQYLAETVNCPVMGELGRRHCLDYQARPLAHTNPQRARLFHACKTCPNRRVAP